MSYIKYSKIPMFQNPSDNQDLVKNQLIFENLVAKMDDFNPVIKTLFLQ